MDYKVIAEALARVLGGIKNGNGWLIPCPAHDDHNPSLSVADGDGGRLLVHCFAGCDARDVFTALRRMGLIDGANMKRLHIVGKQLKTNEATIRGNSLEWSERADHNWRSTIPIIGTPAESYLRSRGCLIPNHADLRFLPAKKSWYPAMVARITDALTGKPLSLHFTLLLEDGSGKAPVERPKVLLKGHRKTGGVIRLTDDVNVLLGLGIGEGIETALAVMAAGWGPVWAAVDASNIANFPVLPGIESLTIFADYDKAGLIAAQRCEKRWHTAGHEVRIVTPSKFGLDWADIAKRYTV